MSTKRWIGRWLLFVGVAHCVAGVFRFAGPLADIARAGILNSVRSHPDRSLAVWFIFGGLLILLVGGLTDWVEERSTEWPRWFGPSLLAFSIVGCVLAPVSGFWLVLPPAIGAACRR